MPAFLQRCKRPATTAGLIFVLVLAGVAWKHQRVKKAAEIRQHQKAAKRKAGGNPPGETRSAKAARLRLRDFYGEQAEAAMKLSAAPACLADFPGLDQGQHGHWGVLSDKDWKDARWNRMDSGSVVCGVFQGKTVTVPKAVCVRLGDHGEISACFNPGRRLALESCWKGGFLRFSTQRFGLCAGCAAVGSELPVPAALAAGSLATSWQYLGYYRSGTRVIFSVREDGMLKQLSPWIREGQVVLESVPETMTQGGTPQWPGEITTKGELGRAGGPYEFDTITLPFQNPWNSLMFLGDHDFFSNGDAAICTIMGDVWIVKGIGSSLENLRWRRFAAGLHQPLGLRIVGDRIHVLGRDQLTRLHDLNGDGEADFYECVNHQFATSAAGHQYNTGLQVDAEGWFYMASSQQGLCRIAPDGSGVTSLASGLRNPKGVALGPRGEIVTNSQEGDWTPASMICQIQPGSHYGYGGVRPGDAVPALPLCYLPRGVDHSSGGPSLWMETAGDPSAGN